LSEPTFAAHPFTLVIDANLVYHKCLSVLGLWGTAGEWEAVERDVFSRMLTLLRTIIEENLPTTTRIVWVWDNNVDISDRRIEIGLERRVPGLEKLAKG
jgi:hypothetical protein